MLKAPEDKFPRKKALVLGNGPSLKQEYFSDIIQSGIPCIGMNAAYRYWERICWYPYAYACVDVKVGMHHAGKILELIEKGLCRYFLLRANLLDEYPQFQNRSNVLFYEQVAQNTLSVCRKYGLEHKPSVYFQSSHPNKITTGAQALRFAAYLGFSQIGILGVDCNYVEIIPEAEKVEEDGVVLRMTATPLDNPNYFFSDYQQAGDVYHVPNPTTAGNEPLLHFFAVELVGKDAIANNLNLDFAICTKQSELYAKNVFPYTDVETFLEGTDADSTRKPFFSIVTITKNSENTIDRTMRSVLEQTFSDLEYIIIDGGSTDGTMQIVKSYQDTFGPRLKWVSQPDGGIYEALNKGTRMASGKYINVINSDDWLELTACEQAHRAIRNNPGHDVYYGKQIWHNSKGKLTIEYFHPHTDLLKSCLDHEASFVSKETYERLGYYDKQLRLAADYLFFLKAYLAGMSFFPMPDKIISHFSSGGLSQQNKDLYLQEMEFVRNSLVGHGHKGKFFVFKYKAFLHKLYQGAVGVAIKYFNIGRKCCHKLPKLIKQPRMASYYLKKVIKACKQRR